MDITNLTGLNHEELAQFFESIGEKPYRGKQIFSWIHHHRVISFDEMTNMSKSLREKLNDMAILENLTLKNVESSKESTSKKFLFNLSDGLQIESVLMSEGDRNTVCLSSQIGCPIGCRFCATGKMGFIRNLTTAEIVGQLIAVRNAVDTRITNVVFMGMGEPFLNYENVIKAANIINNKFGFSIGARKITISTAGIVPKINRFTDEGHRFNLAFSLNATDEATRQKLMPMNKKYTMRKSLEALENYTLISKQFVTLEYVLIAGVNNSEEDAERLKNIISRFKCKLNVIPYNPILNADYKRPTRDELNEFLKVVLPSNRAITVRWSLGKDITAACGQLYTQMNP